MKSPATNSKQQFEYTLIDHPKTTSGQVLGNARVSFADLDENGTIDPNTEILQTQSYYPFGLTHSGLQSPQSGKENLYQNNGKELQSEIGWLDYGARVYDPSVGRWNALDIFSDNFYSLSPYSYVGKMVTLATDIEGKTIWIYGVSENSESWALFKSHIEKYFNNQVTVNISKGGSLTVSLNQGSSLSEKQFAAYNKLNYMASSSEVAINANFSNYSMIGYDAFDESRISPISVDEGHLDDRCRMMTYLHFFQDQWIASRDYGYESYKEGGAVYFNSHAKTMEQEFKDFGESKVAEILCDRNERGHLTSITGLEAYSIDANGNIIGQTNVSYDSDGKVTDISYSDNKKGESIYDNVSSETAAYLRTFFEWLNRDKE